MTMYAAVDVETTGLKQGPDKLLEIALYAVDPDTLEPVSDGYHAIVKYDKRVAGKMRAAADPFVRDMHDKTGLWLKLSGEEAKPLEQIDAELVDYLTRFGAPGEMPVMGNSVRLDMNFMDMFLPETADYLSYHMRDVSTIAGLAADWYDLPWFQKNNDHTAKTDILECLRELKHYRDAIFKPVSETNRHGRERLINDLKICAHFVAHRDESGKLTPMANFTRERIDKTLMAAAVALGGTPERFKLRDTTEDEPLEGDA